MILIALGANLPGPAGPPATALRAALGRLEEQGVKIASASSFYETPAWPDPTYPKQGAATLVAAFCEGATGTSAVDIATGLPGPGTLVLPLTQSFLP